MPRFAERRLSEISDDGCKILGPDVGEAATRARGAADEINQARKGACGNVKIREYSNAAQGNYSGDDTPIC